MFSFGEKGRPSLRKNVSQELISRLAEMRHRTVQSSDGQMPEGKVGSQDTLGKLKRK